MIYLLCMVATFNVATGGTMIAAALDLRRSLNGPAHWILAKGDSPRRLRGDMKLLLCAGTGFVLCGVVLIVHVVMGG